MPVSRYTADQSGREGHFSHPYLPGTLRQTKLPFLQATPDRLTQRTPEPTKATQAKPVKPVMVVEDIKKRYPNQPWRWSERENEPPRPVSAIARNDPYKRIDALIHIPTGARTRFLHPLGSMARAAQVPVPNPQPIPLMTARPGLDSSTIGFDEDESPIFDPVTAERHEKRRILQQTNWVGLPPTPPPEMQHRASVPEAQTLQSSTAQQDSNERARTSAYQQEHKNTVQDRSTGSKTGLYSVLAATFGRASDPVAPVAAKDEGLKMVKTYVRDPQCTNAADSDEHRPVLAIGDTQDNASDRTVHPTPSLTEANDNSKPTSVSPQSAVLSPRPPDTRGQLAPTKSELDALCAGLFTQSQREDALFLPDLSDDETETVPVVQKGCTVTFDPTSDQKKMIASIDNETLILNTSQDLLDLLDNVDNPSMCTRQSSCFQTVNEQKTTSANARSLFGKIKRIELNTFPDEYGLKKLHDVARYIHKTDDDPVLFEHLKSIKLSSEAINTMYALVFRFNTAEHAYQLITNFTSIGNPTFLCLEHGWFPSFGKPLKAALTTLRQHWKDLEAIHVHRVDNDLPFFLPGVAHYAHFTDQAWPFQGDPGYIIDVSENVEYDELDEDPTPWRFSSKRYLKHVNKLQMIVKFAKENVADAIKLEVYREQQAQEQARRAVKRRCNLLSKSNESTGIEQSSDGEEGEVWRLQQAVKRADKAVAESEWSGRTRWIVSYPQLDRQKQILLHKALSNSDGLLASRIEWGERKGRIRCAGCGWRS